MSRKYFESIGTGPHTYVLADPLSAWEYASWIVSTGTEYRQGLPEIRAQQSRKEFIRMFSGWKDFSYDELQELTPDEKQGIIEWFYSGNWRVTDAPIVGWIGEEPVYMDETICYGAGETRRHDAHQAVSFGQLIYDFEQEKEEKEKKARKRWRA